MVFYTLRYVEIGLATTGVCVFCAVTLVAALFVLMEDFYEKEYLNNSNNDISV